METIKDEYHQMCVKQVPAQLQELATELGVLMLCDSRQGHGDWIAWISGEPHFKATDKDAQAACAALLHRLIFGNDTGIKERIKAEIDLHNEKLANFYDSFQGEKDPTKIAIWLRLTEREKGIVQGLQLALEIVRSPLPQQPGGYMPDSPEGQK